LKELWGRVFAFVLLISPVCAIAQTNTVYIEITNNRDAANDRASKIEIFQESEGSDKSIGTAEYYGRLEYSMITTESIPEFLKSKNICMRFVPGVSADSPKYHILKRCTGDVDEYELLNEYALTLKVSLKTPDEYRQAFEDAIKGAAGPSAGGSTAEKVGRYQLLFREYFENQPKDEFTWRDVQIFASFIGYIAKSPLLEDSEFFSFDFIGNEFASTTPSHHFLSPLYDFMSDQVSNDSIDKEVFKHVVDLYFEYAKINPSFPEQLGAIESHSVFFSGLFGFAIRLVQTKQSHPELANVNLHRSSFSPFTNYFVVCDAHSKMNPVLRDSCFDAVSDILFPQDQGVRNDLVALLSTAEKKTFLSKVASAYECERITTEEQIARPQLFFSVLEATQFCGKERCSRPALNCLDNIEQLTSSE